MKRKLLFLITIVLFALVVTSCGCGGSGGGSGGGGGKEPEKKTLEAITLVVDKTTIEFGESINLSFTTTPDKPETHNDKAYDPLCVEYYVTVDGVTTLVSNRSETATYTPSVCGVITLYAKYCNHKMHSGSENDVVSQTVSVTVRGKSIATAEDLEKLSGSSDAFELSNDIDLGGIEWTPISFSGTLDGKGFSIRNFKITENIDRAGFFSTLSGTVRDLDISDAEILVRGSKTYAGLLAAELKGTVVNVTVNGVVNAKYSNYVGGVVGYGYTGSSMTDVKSYVTVAGNDYVGGVVGYNYATITNAESHDTVDGEKYVGGIAGYSNATVKSLKNNGAVSCGTKYCGGIFGEASGTVEQIYNYATVSGKDYTGGVIGYIYTIGSIDILESEGDVSGKSYVGGFVGYAATELKALVNNNSVTAIGQYVGGIAGYAYKLTNCTNNGSITSSADGDVYIGGLGGYVSSDVTGCENYTDISATGNYVGGIAGYVNQGAHTELKNEGEISGKTYTGGVYGYVQFGTVEDATNLGSVSGNDYVGGIVGYFHGSKIEIATNAGEITGKNYTGGIAGCTSASLYGCENTADVTGNHYTGGYVGYGNLESATLAGLVNNNTVSGGAYLGGIAGYFLGSINDCENHGELIQTAVNYESSVAYSYLGGIAGRCENVKNCENSVALSAEGAYVGGIAGYVSSKAESCDNSVEITGTSYVGGIAGYIGKAELCNNYANITGDSYVGGIGGYIGTANNCKNEGEIVIKGRGSVGGIGGCILLNAVSCVNYADVEGVSLVGGISGAYLDSSSAGELNFNSNVNYGDITGSEYVGGLTGGGFGKKYRNSKTALIMVFNKNINNGEVVGTSCVGGIIGGYNDVILNSNAYLNVSEHFLVFSENVNNADVSGESYVAGVMGYFSFDLQRNFYGGDGSVRVTLNENNGNVSASVTNAAGIVGYIKGSYHYSSGLHDYLYAYVFDNVVSDSCSITSPSKCQTVCAENGSYTYFASSRY